MWAGGYVFDIALHLGYFVFDGFFLEAGEEILFEEVALGAG